MYHFVSKLKNVCCSLVSGGMNNYSLPRTPEDILSNVDEMDTQDGGE